MLLSKLKATNSGQVKKYRKLAKSTLVLIPLFGVHYVVFIGLIGNPCKILPQPYGYHIEVAKLYFEMSFNSFQGLIVSILFCFANGEVQSEIRKVYIRYKTSGRNSRSVKGDSCTISSLQFDNYNKKQTNHLKVAEHVRLIESKL